MPRHTPIPPGGDPREHPALKGGHVVILSGEKPIFKQHMQGPQGHAALGSILEQGGFDYEPVHGKYNGDKQPGYIVHVKDEGEVEKLKGIAKRMGQEAIVHSHANTHQYVYTAGPDEGKATPPSQGVNWLGEQEPDDNFTTLYGPGGEPLGHFSYNIDFEHPMVQHGPTGLVDVPEAAQQVLKSAVEAYRGILLDLRKRESDRLLKTIGGANPAAAHGAAIPVQPKAGITVARQKKPKDTKKYEVESHGKNQRRGSHKTANDISAQFFENRSKPYSDNVVGGGPIHVQKTETNMKLHDLIKSQVDVSLRKAQCQCGKAGCKWCGSGTKPSNEQGEHGGSPQRSAAFHAPKRVGPGPEVKKGEETPGESHGSEETSSPEGSPLRKDFGTSNTFSNKLADIKSKPLDPNPETSPAAAAAKDAFTQRAGGKMTIKNSIFKKMPDMSKAETIAHATAKRNGGTIKLGKQEFFIDLKNANDPAKRLKNVHPAAGTKDPFTSDPKSADRAGEGKASGGDITRNAPKAGPDQKNAPENSAVTGTASKSSGKNDLIEKAQTSMAAPQAPKAPGTGSPKLPGAAPAKPSSSAPGGAPQGPGLGKALMPFSQANAAQAAHSGAPGAAAPAAAPKAEPKAPSAYDPSLYAPPPGGVKSGLLTQRDFDTAKQPLSGVGVTPKPAAPAGVRSPALHRNIQGFLGKGELCKSCGKSHPLGKCQ